MKKLLCCLIFGFFSFSSFATDIYFTPTDIEEAEGNTQQWVTDHVTQLQLEEIELLANAIYLMHTLALIDAQVRKMMHSVLALTFQLHEHALQSTDNPQAYCSIKEQLELLERISYSRNITLQAWESCIEYLELNPIDALEQFNSGIRKAVIDFTKDQDGNLHEKLDSATETVHHVIQLLRLKAQTFQAIIDGNNPIWPGNTEDKELFAVDAASVISKHILQSSWKTVETVLPLIEHEESIQEIIRFNCAVYYKALFAFFEEIKDDEQNMVILFDSNGIIPEEKRVDLLPNPIK